MSSLSTLNLSPKFLLYSSSKVSLSSLRDSSSSVTSTCKVNKDRGKSCSLSSPGKETLLIISDISGGYFAEVFFCFLLLLLLFFDCKIYWIWLLRSEAWLWISTLCTGMKFRIVSWRHLGKFRYFSIWGCCWRSWNIPGSYFMFGSIDILKPTIVFILNPINSANTVYFLPFKTFFNFFYFSFVKEHRMDQRSSDFSQLFF